MNKLNLYKQITFWIYFFIFWLFISGCTTLSPIAGDKSAPATFSLSPRLVEQQPIDQEGHILTVYRCQVNAIYDSPRIAYSTEPYSVAYYAFNEWVSSPADMLTPLIRDTLERSGQFSAVVPSSSRNYAELAVDTELEKLLHKHEDGNSYGRIVLHARLIDLKNHQIIATKSFDLIEDAETNDPIGGIKALNKALEKVLKELTIFVTENAKLKSD